MKRPSRQIVTISINEKKEKDIIKFLRALNSNITIAQFVKVAIWHFIIDINDLIDSEDSTVEDRQKYIDNIVFDEIKAYSEEHSN